MCACKCVKKRVSVSHGFKLISYKRPSMINALIEVMTLQWECKGKESSLEEDLMKLYGVICDFEKS